MASTFLKSGPHHFTSNKPFFGPPSGKTMRQFCHFRPHRILKNRRKNEYNLFMDPFGFELGAKLVRPVCLDGPSNLFGLIFYRIFTRFCKKVLLAAVGSTFLKSGPQHFTSSEAHDREHRGTSPSGICISRTIGHHNPKTIGRGRKAGAMPSGWQQVHWLKAPPQREEVWLGLARTLRTLHCLAHSL